MRKDLRFTTKPLKYFNDSRISEEDSIQLAEENLLLRTSWNDIDKSGTKELYKYSIEGSKIVLNCITYERYTDKNAFKSGKDGNDKCIINGELYKRGHNVERRKYFRKLINRISVGEIDEGWSPITEIKVNAFILFHVKGREFAFKYVNRKVNLLNKKLSIKTKDLDDIRELIETGYIKKYNTEK